jgi:hypothetical protein
MADIRIRVLSPAVLRNREKKREWITRALDSVAPEVK